MKAGGLAHDELGFQLQVGVVLADLGRYRVAGHQNLDLPGQKCRDRRRIVAKADQFRPVGQVAAEFQILDRAAGHAHFQATRSAGEDTLTSGPTKAAEKNGA